MRRGEEGGEKGKEGEKERGVKARGRDIRRVENCGEEEKEEMGGERRERERAKME